MTRAEKLMAYVEDSAGRPATWGVSDCSMWVARWIEYVTDRTVPAPHYIGEEHGRALIAAHSGGMVGLWSDLAERVGFLPTSFLSLEVGDVCLIDTGRYGPVGAIWGGHGCAYWRTLYGVTMIQPRPDRVIAAWAVP